jgi:hypothetical protein
MDTQFAFCAVVGISPQVPLLSAHYPLYIVYVHFSKHEICNSYCAVSGYLGNEIFSVTMLNERNLCCTVMLFASL